MSGLVLDRLTKRFGAVSAVDDVNLSVAHGTFVCLLGPSGCGKTTLLRMIAGLEEPSSGRVLIDDRDITGLDAHQRDFGMVFQSLALFPHLTVGQNIAYPLRIRSAPKDEQQAGHEISLAPARLRGPAISKLSAGRSARAIARACAIAKCFLLTSALKLDARYGRRGRWSPNAAARHHTVVTQDSASDDMADSWVRAKENTPGGSRSNNRRRARLLAALGSPTATGQGETARPAVRAAASRLTRRRARPARRLGQPEDIASSTRHMLRSAVTFVRDSGDHRTFIEWRDEIVA